MGAEMRSMTFAVTVDDSDRWTGEHLAACDASGAGGYSDWVIEQIEARMRAAGDAFIAENPDLFRATEVG